MHVQRHDAAEKAAEVGIPVRIAHCHNPQNMDKSVIGHVQGFLHRVNHHSLSRYANVLWACSTESAKWASPAMDLPCEVIPNAIDAQMFRFSEQVRREVREQYGLEDCLVVGHVGRLQYQKTKPSCWTLSAICMSARRKRGSCSSAMARI